MSKPWEAYATTGPAPAEAPAATAPVAQPAEAPAAQPPAPQAGAPWAQYASGSVVQDVPDGGLHGTVTDEGPYHGLAPTQDKAELLNNLRTLTDKGADPGVIRSYVRESGASMPKETEDWLDGAYTQGLAKPDRTGVPFQAVKPQDVGTGDAVWSGLQAGALGGFDDEWQAGAGALGNKLGHVLGLNATDASLGDVYDQILQERRQHKNAAYSDNPVAYGAGYVPGMLLQAFATRGRGAPAESLWGRLGQAAAEGAKGGAISGAGNADSGWGNRIMGGLEGAGVGALLGPALYPLGAMLGGLATRAANTGPGRAIANAGTRVGNMAEDALDAGRGFVGMGPAGNARAPLRVPENSGLDVLDARAPQDAAALTAGTGRLIDRVDESGRGVVRDAAGKMTPGRQAVAAHADEVYASAQDRVADAARRNIAPQPQTARQLERQIRGDKNLGGDDEAGVLMGEQMEPLRGKVIQIDDDLKGVLATREGQAALRAAEGLMTDPAEREVVRKLLAAARVHAKGVPEVDEVLRKEVPGWDDMPQKIKDAYLAQRPDLLERADPFANTPLTLDIADKFARAMKGRAAKTPGLERVARDFSNAVRGSARAQVPEYDAALNAYGASQNVADAAAGAGRFEDSSFLRTPADLYADTVGMASAAPGAIANEAGDLTVSAQDALRRLARDEVVDAATSGSGAGAGGVARQLAFGGGDSGAGQAARSSALLGEEGTNALRRDMTAEVNRVRNTDFIDPRRGSQTQSRGQDAIIDGFSDALGAATSKWSAIHTAAKWLKQGGIRSVDAERLARDAISEDPARIDAAIAYLAQKGMARARATRFVQVFSGALGGRMGGAAQDDGARAPAPNSVRALYKTPTKQGVEK